MRNKGELNVYGKVKGKGLLKTQNREECTCKGKSSVFGIISSFN